MKQVSQGRLAARTCAALLVVLFAVPSLFAQSRGASTIQGVVHDESAAPMPGVTVTLSSPALQVPQLTAVSESDGGYAFRNLPPGIYKITFTLSQFQTVVYADVQLNAGFVARMDATLKVGSVSEAITVTGQSAVVDAKTTTASVNFTKDSLATLPTTHAMFEILAMAPGVVMPQQDIGGSKLGSQIDYKSYGIPGQAIPLLEGIDIRQESDTSMSMHFDYNAVEESQVKSVANDAEVALNGVNWIAIVKSGGNAFHGAAGFSFQDKSLQASNIDDFLRSKGITRTDGQNYLRDFSAELGGPIVKDKLWFFAALRDQRASNELTDYVCNAGPDKVYLTGDEPQCATKNSLTNQTAKLSYQINPRYKLIGFYQRNAKLDDANGGAGKFRPKEAALILDFVPTVWKAELQATPNPRLLVNLLGGYMGYASIRHYQPGADVAGNPSRFYRETGLFAGPHSGAFTSLRTRAQGTGSVAYFPRGSFLGKHELKAGFSYYFGTTGRETASKQSGNYLLTFDKVGALSNQPVEITTYNYPVSGAPTRETELGIYVKDSWAITKRLTANVGLRADRFHAYVNAQDKEQGTFGASGSFPAVEVLRWMSVAPRIGFAFDVTGSGKSVIKASYGQFNHSMGDSFAQTYNVNTVLSTTYRWNDRNGNKDYDPGEVNLALNGPDFLSTAGSSSALINRDLAQPKTHEASLGYERELAADFSFRTLYVYKRQSNLFENSNVLRPYSAWDIPITRRDPGPDGVLGNSDDAGSVRIYDYNAAFRGAAFVGTKPLNAASSDYFHNIEATINKRNRNKWDMMLTAMVTKNHRQLDYVADSPNENLNKIDNTWEYLVKLTGSYRLPWGVQFAAFYTQRSGSALQRTYVFRATDPDGGTALRQQTTVTARVGEYGALRLPTGKLLSFRASKDISLGASRRVTVGVDLFNALNSNAAQAMVVASGSTFGSITQVPPPRIARIGATFKF